MLAMETYSIFKQPGQVALELAQRFRAKRKALGYSQADLARRSGVSLGSLRRFESSGMSSLEHVLLMASILECLEDFERVLAKAPEEAEEREEVHARLLKVRQELFGR